MVVLTAVRLVAGSTSLLESRLMMVWFLPRVSHVRVAAQADIDRIGPRKPRLPACVGAMAVRALARRTRMRNFGGLDELGFIVVASYAQSLAVRLRQHHFSIFCRCVADLALLFGERRMRE